MDGRVEVVLLDCGGVVLPSADPSVVEALEQRLNLQAGRLETLLYEGDPWYDLSTGKLDEEEYWRRLGQEIGRDPGELRRLLSAIWLPTRPDEEVIALVRAIWPRLRVAMLSNAAPALDGHLQSLGIAYLFDPIINSARVGLRKPDPRIFLHALDVLRVDPDAVLFVDDKERNTAVAEDLGIPSIRFENAGQLNASLARHGLLPPSVVR